MKNSANNIKLKKYNLNNNSQIEGLLDKSFGPGRFAKTAYRLRENNKPLTEASISLWKNDKLIGNIEHWPILIGDIKALLLGPIVIDDDYRGLGYASLLINECFNIISDYPKFKAILLVGDLDYYQRFGFTNKNTKQIMLPGPVDKNRLLLKELDRLSLKDGQILKVKAAAELINW